MLEWVCPQCNREVLPGLDTCPFCGNTELKAPAVPRRLSAREKQRLVWADLYRGFRFGLGFVAAVATAYFVAYLVAYFWNLDALVDRLTHWLPGR